MCMLTLEQLKARELECEESLNVMYVERALMRTKLRVLSEKIRAIEVKLARARARLDLLKQGSPDPYTSPLWDTGSPPTPLSDKPE